MVQLDILQGYGHESDCSSERRVVISGLGWRAQCCERDEREQEKETEDMAAPECEREARKRRERRDSGCTHERKERRPHSEERPQAPLPPPPLQDYNRLESERRAERLSRARRPQFGVKRRRPPVRIQRQPKENEHHSTIREDIRCSTPPNFEYVVVRKPQLADEPETLDVAALTRQERLGSVEPTSGAEDAAELEFTAAERARRDERNAAPHNALRRDQPSPDRRLDKINKKIANLRKSIGKREADWEAQNGHAITHSERISDVQLTHLHGALRRLQAEKRCIISDPVEYSLKLQAAKQQKERDEKLEIALRSEKSMVDIVKDIEEWLDGCRQVAGRASTPEPNWTSNQLAAEKACVQRALLRLEAARGRPPAHSVDRGAARHLYERYRTVKRVLASTRPDALGNGELATIHEHEAMLFKSNVDSSSDSQEKPTDSSQNNIETSLQSPPTRDLPPPPTEEIPSSASSAKSAASEEVATSNEALHCLGLEDLNKALVEAKILKCSLRRNIKDYEVSFEMLNSRKVQRDDKKCHEDDYMRYKAVKARIKLITALINKHKTL